MDMEYRRLGDSDLLVSAICLGTMTFGQQNSLAEAHGQLDYAFERGVNFIDTAEMYPVPPRAETCGRTESIVGAWLAGKPRDRIILATKVTGPRRALNWIRGGPRSLDGDKHARRPGRLPSPGCAPITWTCTRFTGPSGTRPCSASISSTRPGKPTRYPSGHNWRP
jgi:hypothetical protein